MSAPPTFDDIFSVMAAASLGNIDARVALPDDIDVEDVPTKFAVALNVLLDELAFRYQEAKDQLDSRLRLEEQLLHAQKMEGIGRLAGGVAHDFNNILSVILGYCTLCMESVPAQAPMREELQEIRLAAERAAALTRQLLAFSRKQVLAPTNIDLRQLVAGMDSMLRRMIGEDVELRTRTVPNLDLIRADPGQIEQVIMNLAINARDAMPEGGELILETANVELDADYARQHPAVMPGSYVMLAAIDNGIGMEKEVQQHVFEPFFTTKPADKGSGLGLSTVFGIVQQSGGNIFVQSELGKGSAFKLYFPRVEGDALPVFRSPELGSPRGRETILLAEDEPQVRRMISGLLRRNGYTVLEAENGATALRVASQHQGCIDLLMTDVIMPQVSGKQLVERLLTTRPGIRVLYVSGYTGSSTTYNASVDRGYAFLQKPFVADALMRKVREVLDSSPRT